MRITFLITWVDEMGGTELAVLTQARHLAATGHEVEVVSVFRTRAESFFPAGDRVAVRYLVDRTGPWPRPVRDHTLDEDTCRTLAARRSTLIDPLWEPAFDGLSDTELDLALRTLDTDVVVTASPALMSAVTDLAPAGVVTVHQEHRPSQHRGGTGGPLLARAPEVDAVVVLTEWTKGWFEESLGAAAPRLEAIPNAVPDGFRPRSARTGKTVVVARRLVADKQVDHAVIAFGKALVEHPGWRLRIFGEGPLTGSLRRLVGELGLHNSVELLGPTRRMTDEWAKASFTVLPSQTEGFGLVLVEAFAAGVPAVAYDVPTGPAEIVRHGVDGLLVPAGDTEALAAAMGRLMGDEELLHRLGERAARGAGRFAAGEVNARWEALFQELYAGRQDPGRLARRADRAARRRAVSAGGGFQPQAPASRVSPSRGVQRAREDELAATSRTKLVRSAGRLAEVRDDLLAGDAFDENLRLAAGALRAAGIPYVLLRVATGHPRARLAVDAALRADVYAALASACAGQAVYAELLGPAVDAPGAVLAERLPEVGEVAGLRVYRPYVTGGRTLRYGATYGCDVEFWPAGARGHTTPTRAHALGDTLPCVRPDAVTRVRGRVYGTLKAFTQHLVTDIGFPVDAVYTWVDDADPAWRARLDARRAELGLEPAQSGTAGDAPVRFRNRDELRYSLRSLAMHAPWIRRIFLVTDDQTPSWLAAGHPGLHLVPHREIFADPSALPVFNSHAIESQLHRIDGLAEHFLYLNDDVFLGRTVTPGTFFRGHGGTRFFWSTTAVPPGEATAADEPVFAAAKNNRALLRTRFGAVPTHCFLHTPHALRRSVLTRLHEEFPDALARTARSPLRDWRDVSPLSSLAHHYGYLTGTAEPSALRYGYVDTGRRAQHPGLSRLLAARSKDAFCLGEGPDSDVPADEQAEVMRAFLEAYFPVKGPYER
ncbi:Glycosyltransferase Gtf1 [Streptomyces sp. RB5]|uniref:Glycosyltransferase Gtf1 n=1 Tax=Streptomyces smaragdinus TaxID=2585196 RepID=A0A7K0CQH2_9ACTN|nr:stealth conserved region 3 domain-containing protein [Streptomyces smaragdinus]MQY15738.1 Glycosyltransferase Gtf1 [Streptomyces smaragdinus]